MLIASYWGVKTTEIHISAPSLQLNNLQEMTPGYLKYYADTIDLETSANLG
jgi:hypothetical protein